MNNKTGYDTVEYPIVQANYTLYVHVIPKEITSYDYDKYYVGITMRNPWVRWGHNGHGYHGGQLFRDKVDKYGFENMKHQIIKTNLTKIDAGILEQFFIRALKSHVSQKHGYNTSWGGFYFTHKTNKSYERKGYGNMVPVVCLNTGEKFKSLSDATRYYHIGSPSQIRQVCIGKSQYAGVDENGNKLVWMFEKDYNNTAVEIIKQIINFPKPTGIANIIICINNHKLFSSAEQAASYCNGSSNIINKCCKTFSKKDYDLPQKCYHSGRDPETGDFLGWMYYNDYILLSEDEKQDVLNRCKSSIRRRNYDKEPIICLNTLETFKSHEYVKGLIKLDYTPNIYTVCDSGNTNRYSGRHLITDEKLHWLRLEVYESLSFEEKQILKEKYFTGSNIKKEEEL